MEGGHCLLKLLRDVSLIRNFKKNGSFKRERISALNLGKSSKKTCDVTGNSSSCYQPLSASSLSPPFHHFVVLLSSPMKLR